MNRTEILILAIINSFGEISKSDLIDILVGLMEKGQSNCYKTIKSLYDLEFLEYIYNLSGQALKLTKKGNELFDKIN